LEELEVEHLQQANAKNHQCGNETDR